MERAEVTPCMRRTKSSFDKENRLWLFMEECEERAYHREVLELVFRNPRFYLDHLHELSEYRVRWENYQPRKKKYPIKRKPL
jgi:hypothetical protein